MSDMTEMERLLMMRRAAQARVKVLVALEGYLSDALANQRALYAQELAEIVDLGALGFDGAGGPVDVAEAVRSVTEALATRDEPDAKQVVAHPAGPAAMQCTGCGSDTFPGEPCPVCAGKVSRLPSVKPAPKADDHRADAAAYVPAPRQAKADLPTAKEKPLTEDEIAEVLERDARGQSSSQIAHAVGRKVFGFNQTIAMLRRQAEAEAEEDEDEDQAAEDAGAPNEPPAPEAPEGLWQFKPKRPASFARASADVHNWLDELGYTKPWAPDHDLKLAQIIVSGAGVAGAVEALGLERAQILERWHQLLPEKGLDQQARLLAALEYRAAAWLAPDLDAADAT